MSVSDDKRAEIRVKYLEMIQSIIARLSNQGAALKNYSIALTVAASGLSISSKHPSVAGLAIVPLLVFSLLDAKYLQTERRFRRVFESARGEGWEEMPSFDLDHLAKSGEKFGVNFWSWAVFGFYVPQYIILIFVVVVLGGIYGL